MFECSWCKEIGKKSSEFIQEDNMFGGHDVKTGLAICCDCRDYSPSFDSVIDDMRKEDVIKLSVCSEKEDLVKINEFNFLN